MHTNDRTHFQTQDRLGNLETHPITGVTNFHINNTIMWLTHRHTHAVHWNEVHSYVPCMLSLLFYHKQYICQSTEEPSGGGARPPQPVLPSTCWNKQYDILLLSNIIQNAASVGLLFVPLSSWICVLPLTGDCLRGCRVSFVVFPDTRTADKRLHNEKSRLQRENKIHHPSNKKSIATLSVFQVTKLRVNGVTMGERFNLEQEK